jgi:hypothetical protein
VIFVKHPIHGNKHVPESEYPALKEEGWVKWPRSAAEKNAAPLSSPLHVVSPEAGAAPTIESLRAVLEEKGFAYDKRWGLKRLQEALDGDRA